VVFDYLQWTVDGVAGEVGRPVKSAVDRVDVHELEHVAVLPNRGVVNNVQGREHN